MPAVMRQALDYSALPSPFVIDAVPWAIAAGVLGLASQRIDASAVFAERYGAALGTFQAWALFMSASAARQPGQSSNAAQAAAINTTTATSAAATNAAAMVAPTTRMLTRAGSRTDLL